MKRILILLVAVFFLVGCASTLTRTETKDGVKTLKLNNYVFAETIFCEDGKTVCQQNSMIPSDTIMKDLLSKMMDAIKSITGIAGGVTGDVTKTVIPSVVK